MMLKLTYHPRMMKGEGITEKKLGKIKKKLEKRPLFSGVFLIVLSKNPVDQLEIYSARLLAQKYYEKYPPYIVGIAASYDEAVGLVEKLAGECVRERGDCALKEYLLCQV